VLAIANNNDLGGAVMTPNETNTRLLTIEETAEQLGVKPATIRSWILKREKIEVVKVGRLVRIKESSVQEFIEKNTIPPRRGEL
jgi:excisionase family DNA binding protein